MDNLKRTIIVIAIIASIPWLLFVVVLTIIPGLVSFFFEKIENIEPEIRLTNTEILECIWNVIMLLCPHRWLIKKLNQI